MVNQVIRNRQLLKASLTVCAAVAVLTASNWVYAQSGSRTPSRSRTQSGSSSRSASSAVALEGYCPVCIIDMKRWVRGTSEHQVKYDGITYLFPGQEQKNMFLANPAKYVPALGGDCTVCLHKMGKRTPGNIRYASLYENRLFLFPSDEQKREFVAHPEQYGQVDLALGGICAVCRVELKQDVQGKPEIAAFHRGLRYLFPSDKQREMFLADPEKYAIEPTDRAILD